jgi:6-phosphofructokinase 1
MTAVPPDFRTDDLGEGKIVSPLRATRFMDTSKRLLFRSDIDELREQLRAGVDPPAFELAGPRESIYFNPGTLRCGIVTCGGLCPGLNDVIRSIVFCLHEKYGVPGSLRLPFRLRGSSRGKRIDADRIDDPQSKSNP